MAYIKKKSERKFKIIVCNGYKGNGQKRMKAQTITVPSSVPKRGIQQYVMAEAERIEKKFKYGVEESDQTHFDQYAENWLKRQEPFFKATTYAGYKRNLGIVYPLIGGIPLAKLLPIHHLRKQTAYDPFEQISGSTGLMGVADTSWVMQRKRMSQTADILLTGRDMDDRTLHFREENCIWTLEDEETAEEREIKAVPDYLWKAAKYIESVGNWQGTASELLAAAGIENAKLNQFTYNMAKYFDKVFEPKNIRYKTHRKNKVRLLNFYGDDGDGGDDDIDITQLSGWGIPERPSPSSLGALEGSKHGRSVATGQPAEKPTGPAPNPCEAASA